MDKNLCVRLFTGSQAISDGPTGLIENKGLPSLFDKGTEIVRFQHTNRSILGVYLVVYVCGVVQLIIVEEGGCCCAGLGTVAMWFVERLVNWFGRRQPQLLVRPSRRA